MAGAIGKSTSPNTADIRSDVPGPEVASFRYNNPGAQYPAEEAARFGQIGYGIIGHGQNKIARFPSPVNGAASNFDLLFRKYMGMSIGAAGGKWTGGISFGIPGYPSARILTRDMLDDPEGAIALLKAIAHRESGKGNNLSEEQWRQAHRMFKLGSADAFLAAEPKLNVVVSPGVASGEGLLKRALEHVGEEYKNVRVPKDNANWKGPWDCAEFISWLVFQEAGILYGCVEDAVPPAQADAYTGAWKADMLRLGTQVSVEQAAATVGGILLRYPPNPDAMGHIVLCDGRGGTVEAKGARYGVVRDTVQGRHWDAGILIPAHISYTQGPIHPLVQPAVIYRPEAPNMDAKVVVAIQEALLRQGIDPGGVDGEYGAGTQAAVVEFQRRNGLTADGEVGPETAGALGISLTGEAVVTPGPAAPLAPGEGAGSLLLFDLIRKLLADQEKPMAEETPKSPTAPEDLLLLLLRLALASKPADLGRIEGIVASLRDAAAPPPTAAVAPATPATIPQPIAQQPAAAADDSAAALLMLTRLLAERIGPQVAEVSKTLGPVNGALGETIGKLLNGRKSAIGIIGAVLTQILASSSSGTLLGTIASSVPALAGTSSAFLPVFLGLAAWGALGKAEKWVRR